MSLQDLSLAQLNVAYNRAVVELKLPLKEIKGFKDKPSGVARITRVMFDHNLKLNDQGFLVSTEMTKGQAFADSTPDLSGLAAALTGNGDVTKVDGGVVVAFKPKAKPATKKGNSPAGFTGTPIKTKAATKTKAKKAAVGAHRGPAPEFGDDQMISILVANPKRKGSMAFARYTKYQDGQTVRQAMEAGLRRDDSRNDTRKGFISIK